MSHLIGSDGRLVRDSWPKGIGHLDGEKISCASLQDWEKVPPTYYEICSWAQVALDPSAQERRRENILVYAKPPATEQHTLFPISIRVQGFLEACCLHRLGNWKGNPTNAQRAVHSVTLRSNGEERTWAPIHTAIRHIRQLVQRQLTANNLYEEPPLDTTDDLRLYHRVFQKRQRKDPATVLPVSEDPNQFYPAISQHWALADRIQIGRRMENGGKAACSPLTLSPGDFVDVGITFEIVKQKQRDGTWGFRVHLGFSHVLQLASSDYLKKQKISDKKRSRDDDMDVDRPTAKIQRTIMSFS
ncbi:hypothetical protein BJ138DRAFT_1118278 [Hygrophoropsis aurantiaca]|uniref:Uncharacterized protein n=1 Tax=Hygrophoropsis aurantiaca TaxID=72124 RepID=A0ACB7ZY53_9AGAM|nr:hypothetical protein BJ138DRAFT_1118278 [Hygrophoropsis aurantiaca]